jgi:tetratricopeptide (TPR) repeat protein
MLTRSFMVTIKKRGQKLSSLLLVSSLSIFLSACGPAGPRNVIKGEKLLRKGDYQGAIEHLEDATRQLAKDTPETQGQAWNFLGLAYQSAGQPGPALKAYQQALKCDRNLLEADYNMGVLQIEQKNYGAAVDPLTTYVTLRPHDAEGFTKLGTAQLHWGTQANGAEKQRRLDSARKNLEIARGIQPDAEIDNALGVLYLQRNRPTDAQKEFKAAVQQDPNYAPAVLNLAIVAHQYSRDHRLALQKYRDYLALKPTPDNAPEIQAVVNSLERELNPPVAAVPAPKAVVAAPAPAPVLTNTTTPATKPAVVASVPVKTNAPVAQTPIARTTPATTLPSPRQATDVAKTTTAAPAPPPTEVTQVTTSATPKVAQDISTPAPKPALAAPQPALPATTGPRPIALQPIETKPAKKSFLKKLNPIGWFGKKEQKETSQPARDVIQETPLPDSKPAVASTASSPAAATSSPPKTDIAHYTYISPAKPSPGNARASAQFVSQGTTARRNGHFNDAILAYRNALTSDPANFDAAYLLGLTDQDVSDFQGSLQYFEQALAINPDSTDARYAFAWSLYKGKFPQDAANELEKVVQKTPSDPKANLLLATVYAQNLGEPKLARDHYQRVLEADPHHPQATAIRFWLAANP